jgi:predicted small lipoprotein YifL
MPRKSIAIIITMLFINLISCGQKGTLYLPTTTTTQSEPSNEH